MNEILGLPLFFTALALAIYLFVILKAPVMSGAKKLSLCGVGLGLLTFNAFFIAEITSVMGCVSVFCDVVFFLLMNLILKEQMAEKAAGKTAEAKAELFPIKFWLIFLAGLLGIFLMDLLYYVFGNLLLLVPILLGNLLVIVGTGLLVWLMKAEFFPPVKA